MSVKFIKKGEHSNKGQNIKVTLIADGIGKGYIALIPKIDRLSFTYDIKPKHHEAVFANMLLWKDDGHLTSASAHKSRYKSAFVFTFPDNGATVRIELDPKSTKSPIPFMRFELNPAALGIAGLECFREELYLVLVEEYLWSTIVQKCRVTRLDIAIDLLHVQVRDLIVEKHDKKMAFKRLAYFSASGELETLYPCFKRKGLLAPLCVYNKTQEIEDTGALPVYGSIPHARVEARLNGQKLQGKSLTDLYKIKNPFLGLEVIDPSNQISPPETGHAWSFFLDSCRMRGTESALKMLPTDQLRTAYATALAEADRKVWNVERIWKRWPQTLNSSGLFP